MKGTLGYILFILLHFVSCKPEEIKTKSDLSLQAIWRLDSICDGSGLKCQYPYTDSPWNKTNASLLVKFDSEFNIPDVGGYHMPVSGAYFIENINAEIKISIEEIDDRLYRKKSIWQPYCVATMRNTQRYKITGNQLRLYTNQNLKTIYLTKK